MDLATLAAAQQGVKALRTLAKGAASAAIDHSVKDKLIEIQQGILDAQANLGDAVAERLALLQENAELAGKVRELEAMKAKLDEYVLAEVQPGKSCMSRERPIVAGRITTRALAVTPVELLASSSVRTLSTGSHSFDALFAPSIWRRERLSR